MPTDRQQRCKKCGNRFTRPQGTNRLNCFECRPQRTEATVTSLPPIQTGENGDDLPSLTDLTKRALEEGGVLDTWQAVAAIRLAQLIDEGKHGASGAAGTVKAHREAMSVALADSGEDADIIDLIFGESG